MNFGVFTTIKVIHGIPLFFDEHKKRLVSHARELNFDSVKLTQKDVQDYLQKNNLSDCALKILIEKRDGKTYFSMLIRPLPPAISKGKLITVPDTRDEKKVYKTTDRSVNEQAKKIAEEKGAVDALFTNDGMIVESTICNVFSVNDRGEIITPPLSGKGLQGIIRNVLMQQLPVKEAHIPIDTNHPIILTNSLRMVQATHVDRRRLADGTSLLKQMQTTVETLEKKQLHE